MLLPTAFQRCWKVPVEPVKWMPASSGCGTATSDTAPPLPVTRLMTPGGRPAASSSRIVQCAASCCVGDGFHTTVLPISAGATGRLPAMAVKLNGVIARTKPSSGRWSIRFQTPGDETGCSARTWWPNATLKRRKSISSQALSISACTAVFDWPSMVAALRVSRHGPDSSSAARSSTPARSSYDALRHPGAAASAVSTASSTSLRPASRRVPSTALCRCGWTTSMASPAPSRCRPAMVIVSSTGSALAISLSFASSEARSPLPGAYVRTGSLTGGGTRVAASGTAAPQGFVGVPMLSRAGRGENGHMTRRHRQLLQLIGAVAGALVVLVAFMAHVDATAGPDRATVSQDLPGPVLLVPGYGGSVNSFGGLRARLESTGRQVIVVRLPGNGTGDLREAAKVLQHDADAVLAAGAPSVDVVGYSAGGI